MPNKPLNRTRNALGMLCKKILRDVIITASKHSGHLGYLNTYIT